MPTKTFARETYLGKVSQVGAPNGNNGLFFKNYNKHYIIINCICK